MENGRMQRELERGRPAPPVIIVHLVLLLILVFSSTVTAENELQIFVPSSLRNPVREIAELFGKSNAPWKVVPTSGSSRDLMQNLDRGAPLDVVISNSKEEMETLIKKGTIRKNNQHFLFSDAVVVVAQASTSLEIKEPKDLAAQSVQKAALLPATSGFGKKCRAYLVKTGVTESLKGRIVVAKNIHAALNLLKTNEAQWTFAYGTDVASGQKWKVIWHVPASEIPETQYFAAMVTAGKNQQVAKLFLDTLQSIIAKRIFENAGFRLPAQSAQTQTAPRL